MWVVDPIQYNLSKVRRITRVGGTKYLDTIAKISNKRKVTVSES